MEIGFIILVIIIVVVTIFYISMMTRRDDEDDEVDGSMRSRMKKRASLLSKTILAFWRKK